MRHARGGIAQAPADFDPDDVREDGGFEGPRQGPQSRQVRVTSVDMRRESVTNSTGFERCILPWYFLSLSLFKRSVVEDVLRGFWFHDRKWSVEKSSSILLNS